MMQIKSTSELYGMKCGGCNHALSRHKIRTSIYSKKITGKCNHCNCKSLSIA